MLHDNERDKALQRNQLIAILLMTLLVVVWSYFFLPPPPAPREEGAPVQEAAATAATPAQQTPTPTRELAPGLENLPPVALESNPEEDEVTLGDESLELVFTRIGARLKRAKVLLGDKGADSIQLVPEMPKIPEVPDVPDAELLFPLSLRFSSGYLGDEPSRRRWEIAKESPGEISFTLDLPDLRLTKTFRLTSKAHVLAVEVGLENTGAQPRLLGLDNKELAYSLDWSPNVDSQDANKGLAQEIIWRKEELNTHHPTAKLAPPDPGQAFTSRVIEPDWLAVKSAYFAVAMKPEFEGSEGWVAGLPEYQGFRLGLGAPRIELAPGESDLREFKVYIGPTQLASLAAAWPGLDEVLQYFTMFGFMDTFAKILLGILHWFYSNVLANYGIAIIFLTVLVRLVAFPLTWRSMLSMKKMQKLAPELEKIKAEVGDNQQELQKRMMELYRERGVNPLGGCLPMLLQMPVFFALYRMLWSAFELRRAPFAFWIKDLSEPDRFMKLPFEIPFPFMQQPIDSLNILPILMGAAMVVSTKLMPTSGPVQNPQQKMMMTLMPVMFSVFCYNVASGLNLYILTSTLLGIAQNYVIHVSDINVDVKKKERKKAPGKKQHFYNAAIAKKKEMAKEARRDKMGKKTRAESSTKGRGKKRS